MKRLWHTVWPTLAWVGALGIWLGSIVFCGQHWGFDAGLFAFAGPLIIGYMVLILWCVWCDIAKLYRKRWHSYCPRGKK